MISAPLSSGLQKAVRALVNKRPRPNWKPLPPPPPQGAKPAEVGKGTPRGGDTGTLE